MKVGSLVRNKSFPNARCFGVVVKVYNNDDVRIHWINTGNLTLWSRYSHNLEVLCK